MWCRSVDNIVLSAFDKINAPSDANNAPVGFCYFAFNSGTNYPVPHGVVLSININSYNGFQICASVAGGGNFLCYRILWHGTWAAWKVTSTT